MKLRGRKHEKTNWRVTAARLGIMLAIVVGYGAYWFLTPTQVGLPTVASSSSDPTVMIVTLHNPTFKLVGGEIISITTEVDLPVVGRNTTVPLQAIPRTYYFLLAPQFSQSFSIPFNGRVLTGVQYDITLHIDRVGDQTVTVTLQ